MKGWRYIAQRLPDEAFLDWSVPLEDVEITDVLSGDCSLTGSIPARYGRLIGSDGNPIIQPWATAIWAEKDGEIRGGGIVTQADPDGKNYGIECVGYTGYLAGLPYTGSGYAGIGADPIDIVRVIWNHVQSQPGGNLNLLLGETTTDVMIGSELTQAEYDSEDGPYTYDSGPYKLAWYQDNDLASNVNDLAAKTPFDYHEHHLWVGDSIEHHLEFGYPKIGSQRDDLRFVLGENILAAPQITLSGDDYATDVLVLGAGEGATQVMSLQGVPRSAGLRRVAVVTDSSIIATDSAFARGQRELAWRRNIQEIDSFTVRDHPNAPLGSFSVGDTIYIKGRLPWTTLGTWARITQITTRPSEPNAIGITIARTDKLTS